MGMVTAEGDADRDGFVLAEEPVLGDEAVTGDAELSGRTGVEVAQPIGVGSPGRADHDLAGVGVVGENHGHGVMRLTGLSTDVYQHEEGPAEHPARSAAIEPGWQSEYCER